MLQQAILKGEAVYLKRIVKQQDTSIEELQSAQQRLNNKKKGVKLDQAIAAFVDPTAECTI